MKAIQIVRHGGPEVLSLKELKSPDMIQDGVRIHIRAFGVNFADILMRMGLYPEAPKTPFIPGYEFAGEVLETAKDVTDFKPGDRVFGATAFGAYADEIVLPSWQIRKTPRELTDIDAAAIPVNFLTAWTALHEMARVRKGDRVLIHSAAGGVGTAAVQLAARAGAVVTGTVGLEAKKNIVRDLGAREVWTHDEWNKVAKKGKGNFNVILDPVGGRHLKLSFKNLAPTGRVINFGVSSMMRGEKRSLIRAFKFLLGTPLFTPFGLMMSNRGIFGLNMLQLFGSRSLLETTFGEIIHLFESGGLKPIVDRSFPFAEAATAHAYLSSRQSIGKVVLTTD